MAFVGWVGQTIEDEFKGAKETVTRAADDLLGLDDSGGITGSISNALADLDDGVRSVLADETVMTIANVALVATGNAWAVPILQGASVAAQGGDLEQVLTTAAKAYVAQQVGAKAGQVVGDYAGRAAIAAEYGIDATSQQAAMLAAQETGLGTTAALVGSSFGSAARAATSTAIVGGDVEAAFIAGGIAGAVPQILMNADGYQSLDTPAQNVLASSVTSVLQGAELNGVELTKAYLTSVATNSQIVADAVAEFSYEYDLDANQQAFATTMLNTVVSAGISGQPIPDAIKKAIAQQSLQDLGDTVKKVGVEAWDRLSGDYAVAEKAASDIQAKLDAQQAYINQRNALATKTNVLGTRITNEFIPWAEDGKAGYLEGRYGFEDANNTIEVTNGHIADYKANLAKLNQMDGNIVNFEQERADLFVAYTEAVEDLAGTYDEFYTEFDPTLKEITENVVKVLQPQFDDDVYNEVYKDDLLETGMTAAEHWLKVGQYDNAVTTMDNLNAAKNNEINRLYADISKETGIDMNQLYINEEIFKGLEKVDLSTLRSLDASNWEAIVEKSGVDYRTDLEPRIANDNELPAVPENWTAGTSFDDYVLWIGEDGKSSYIRKSEVPSLTNQWSPALGTTADVNNLGVSKPLITEENLKAYEEGGFDDIYNKLANAANADSDADIIVEIKDIFIDDSAPDMDPADLSLEAYGEIDPEGYLTLVENADNAGVTGVDQVALNYAKAIADLAEASDDPTFQNALANAYRATGGILQSFNGIVVLAGANPADTALGKFAKELVDIGTATNTEDYTKAVEAMKEKISDAEGFGATVEAIYDSFTDSPTEFLAEYVGVEAMQEIVPLLVGGGVGTAARGLALAKGASTKYANIIGLEAGLGAARTSDVIESFGGTAESTYEETYALARQQGYSEAEAAQMATETAVAAGVVSSSMTLLTYGVGGDLLEKSILGDAFADKGKELVGDALAELSSRAAKGVGVTLGEGVSEGIEEGVTQLFIEGQLYRLDPTRDISGNIAAAITLGAVAGGTISGGAYSLNQGVDTGKALTNIIFNTAKTSAPGTVSTNLRSAIESNDPVEAFKVLSGVNSLPPTLSASIVAEYSDANIFSLSLEEIIVERPEVLTLPTIDNIVEEIKTQNTAAGRSLTDDQIAQLTLDLEGLKPGYGVQSDADIAWADFTIDATDKLVQYATSLVPDNTLLYTNVKEALSDPSTTKVPFTGGQFTEDGQAQIANQIYDTIVANGGVGFSPQSVADTVDKFMQGGGYIGAAWGTYDIAGISPTNGADLNNLLAVIRGQKAGTFNVPQAVLNDIGKIASAFPYLNADSMSAIMSTRFFSAEDYAYLESKDDLSDGALVQLRESTANSITDPASVAAGLLEGFSGDRDNAIAKLSDAGRASLFETKDVLKIIGGTEITYVPASLGWKQLAPGDTFDGIIEKDPGVAFLEALSNGADIDQITGYVEQFYDKGQNFDTGAGVSANLDGEINDYIEGTYGGIKGSNLLPNTVDLLKEEYFGDNGVLKSWSKTSDLDAVVRGDKLISNDIYEDLATLLPTITSTRIALINKGFDPNNLPKVIEDAITNAPNLDLDGPIGSNVFRNQFSYDGTNTSSAMQDVFGYKKDDPVWNAIKDPSQFYFIPDRKVRATIEKYGVTAGTQALFDKLETISADEYKNLNINEGITNLIDNLGEITSNGFSLGNKVTTNYVADIGDSGFNLVSAISQATYISPAEIQEMFNAAGYQPTDQELVDFTNKVYRNQAYEVEQYIDDNSVTLEEIKTVAAEEGVADIANAGFFFDELLQGDEKQILAGLRTEFDDVYTTEEEAKAYFDLLGFEPTKEQLAGVIGNTEENANARVAATVDVNRVTADEVLAEFERLGFDANANTTQLAEQFVGDRDQETALEDIRNFVADRQITVGDLKNALGPEFDDPATYDFINDVFNKMELTYVEDGSGWNPNDNDWATSNLTAENIDDVVVSFETPEDLQKYVDATKRLSEKYVISEDEIKAKLDAAGILDQYSDADIATLKARYSGFVGDRTYNSGSTSIFIPEESIGDVGYGRVNNENYVPTDAGYFGDLDRFIEYARVRSPDYIKEQLTNAGVKNVTDEMVQSVYEQVRVDPATLDKNPTSVSSLLEPIITENVVSYADLKDMFGAKLGSDPSFSSLNSNELVGQVVDALLGPEVRAENPDVSYVEALRSFGLTDQQMRDVINEAIPRSYGDIEAELAAQGYTKTDTAIVARNLFNNQATPEDIANYVTERTVTKEDIDQLAALEGISPEYTEQFYEQYVGSMGNRDGKDPVLSSIQATLDNNAFTPEEIKAYFAERGYDATDEEAAQFAGYSGPQTSAKKVEIRQEISDYVDPRQLTYSDIASIFLEEAGVESMKDFQTAEEYQSFVALRGQLVDQYADAVQGDPDYIAGLEADARQSIDQNYTTLDEAKQFFRDAGYDFTDEEALSYIGGFNEDTQKTAINEYVDPRVVTEAEIQAIAEQEGITFEEAMAEAYIGQGTDADFQAQQEAAARAEFDPLATTFTEAQEFFASTGYNATAEELAQFVAFKSEEEQQSAIGEYVTPRIVTETDAQQWFADLGYDATEDEISQFVGQVNDETYKLQQQTALGEYVDPRMVSESEVRQAFTDAGLANPTQSDVQALMGQYEQELLSGKINEALPNAQYNALYELVQQNINNQGGISDEELAAISDLIGKPTQDVNDTDIDFVTDLIAQQEALTEPMTYTPEQLGYDVTGDGIIDSNDLLLMQQAQQGQEVAFSQDSKFAQPTGIYDTVQDVQTNLEQKIDQQSELQTERDLQQEQQLDQTRDYLTEGINVLGQTLGEVGTSTQNYLRKMELQNLIGQGFFDSSKVDVKTPDPAKIGYLYDFESIFANPQQAAMFPSPYAEGGYVDDDEDELYKLLGD